MNETQAKIYNIDVLERGIAASDRELAFMLGVEIRFILSGKADWQQLASLYYPGGRKRR